MSKFEELILQGEKTRETKGLGGPEAAIPIFREALQHSDSTLQDSEARRHLGLCYEHLGRFDEAVARYNEAYNLAQESSSKQAYSAMARTKRHISSCYRKQNQPDLAFQAALEARDLMVKVYPLPTDYIWAVHGIVDALIDAGDQPDKERKWLKEEFNALRYMLPREKNAIRRRVWLTGFLMDTHKVYGFWGWWAKMLAQIIALFSGLALRTKQLRGELK